MSINKAILVGHLGRDPESRSGYEGSTIATFSLATSEAWKDKTSGERKERTQWHRVTVFNQGLADVAMKYLRKGSKVYVEGQIEYRKWVDQHGEERHATDIVLRPYRGEIRILSRPDGPAGAGAAGASPDDLDAAEAAAIAAENRAETPTRPRATDLDDEIPF